MYCVEFVFVAQIACPHSSDNRKYKKGKCSPYSIAERSQPAGDVSYKPGGKMRLLSIRLAVTLTTL